MEHEKHLQTHQEDQDDTTQPAKKLRINENAEFIASKPTENNNSTTVEDEEGSEEEVVCSVCLEPGTAECPILPEHQCPQCSKDAWKICQTCNESLLSRTCPICRGDYAPIVMHSVPGLPLSTLADQSLSEEDRTNLLYKFGIVRNLISKSNVCIWSPVTKKMHFSLPQKMLAEDSQDQSYAIVSITVQDDRLAGDQFLFTNKVWDEIENEVETGEVTAGEIVEQPKAIQSILAVTKDVGHKLFTMLSQEDWQYMLDPKESNDTTEALKAIKNTIFKPILPQFQPSQQKEEQK